MRQFDSQALLCTDTTVAPAQIIEWFVLRWQIEVTFQEARAHLGVETQRQWSDRAIARTTPVLLGLFSWITLAAHLLGNQCLGTPRSAAWYTKSEPTFIDAIALARRHLWFASATFCLSPAKPGYATNPDAVVQQVHRIARLCSLNVQSRVKRTYSLSGDSGNAGWIDEGLAEYMTSAAESMRTEKPIGVFSGPCLYAKSIAALEDLAPDAAENPEEFGCNYSLGQRLFTDLHRTLGGGATRQALRELYVLSQATDETEESTAEGAGISHVRQAFGHLRGASVPIARWYDGSEGYDLSQLDLTLADPALPAINGRIDSAYITVDDGEKVVSGFSVSDAANGEVWLNLDYSYDVSNGQRKVQLDLRSFYEDGFAFQDRTVEIEAESRNEGAAQSVWIGPDTVVPGRYWVYLYDGDRKVAEVQYEVTP